MEREEIYSREIVDSGLMFHGEYRIVANYKCKTKLKTFEKFLGFDTDFPPTKLEVDCYLGDHLGDGIVFNVHAISRRDGRKYRMLLEKEDYEELLKDLELENPEY